MHYVCIEDNKITAILNYEPAVPATVSVTIISDADAAKIRAETHFFDINSKTVVALAGTVIAQKEQDRLNGIEREFLNSTDWKVLRHLRQKALGIPTSLTDTQYLELEQQREAATARII